MSVYADFASVDVSAIVCHDEIGVTHRVWKFRVESRSGMESV